MLNQKSNLHDVVPTSDSSALEHLASNVATNVGTVITAPAPALEAQNAEEDSLPLFLTQAAAQVAAALNVAGTTATQGVSATPAATALFPEHNATADAITATASANAASTSVAATSDAAIADNDVATDAIVASATEVAMSDPATASDTTTDTADTADTSTANTATATVFADNDSVVDANIASPVEVAMSDPATVSDTTTDTTTSSSSSDAAITTTATATATAIADDASVIDSSVASTAEVVMSDPATVSNSNTTLDTTTLDATDATTDIASTTTATTTATTKKGKRSTRAKKPRQPKRTHFPPEPVTNTSEQILSQPKALKQSQLLQVLASSDDEAIQKLLTPQQLAAFSNANANANSSTERLEQVDKLLGVLLRHRGEDKIFLDTLMQESGMSCDAVTEGMRKLRSLEMIRMYSTYVRFYDLESADVYLNTVVRTNEQRKSYSVKYPQEDIKNGILSVEEAFGFYLLKSRKAISFADFTEVVATACTDLEPVQELLVLLYRCGKVQLQDNVLYFVPKKRIPRKAKSSPTSQGGPAGSPAGGQGLAPNGAVATNGASTPAPAASASGATAESAAPTEGKASVEAMTTSSESLEAVSAVPVEATRTEPVKAVAVDTALSVRCNELAEAPVAAVAVDATVTALGSTATASEAADTSLAAPKSAHVAACVAASAVSVASAASAAMPDVPSSGPVAAPVTAKTTAVAGSRHEHLRPSELATAIATMGTSFGGCSSKMREAPLAITCPVPEIQPRGSLALPSGSLAKYDPADVLEPVLSVQALQRTYGDEMGAAFHE